MLQIKNKIDSNAVLFIFPKNNHSIFYFLDKDEQQVIRGKIEQGLRSITYIKQKTVYFLFPVNQNENDPINLEKYRKDGHAIFNQLKEFKENKISVQAVGNVDKSITTAILEGLMLSTYQFNKYLKEKDKKQFTVTALLPEGLLSEEAVNEMNIITESVRITKDLVNEPVSYLTAKKYSEEIKKIAKKAGFTLTVWDQDKIVKEQMGGIIAVNLGSSAPATFNILEYKPAKHHNKKPLVLIGKGVVFDTGGLSLKPTKNSMDWMKSDMAGSAAVVGAMYAIAKLELPYHIVGLIPAVENRPGYEAVCPGDIITMYDGTTVEVMDTDAEGRLILADALHYAKRLNPELVLDFATLTGSAMRAIGKEASVVMGTADKRIRKLINMSANQVCERVVFFPFWEEYGDYMKSDIADLKNLGPAEAGSITAGKFLEHFTDYPWLHFDIAGPAYIPSGYNYRGKYGTAYGVRLMCKFVQNLVADANENRKAKSRDHTR
jgi:leucyl aminopeptidase